MRASKATAAEASRLIIAMQRAKVPGFDPSTFGLQARTEIEKMVRRAKHHHTIQERWCSEDMDDTTRSRLEAKEKGIERQIGETARRFGLTVHFDGDPRGFTVKLHAPASAVYNTWGGAESGYGIGDSTIKETV